MQAGCLSASLGAMAAGLVVPIFIMSGASDLSSAFQRSLFREPFFAFKTDVRLLLLFQNYKRFSQRSCL